MSDDIRGRDRDLVLPPNTYAYVLDSTKGKVSVFVGPYKNSLSNTDQLVTWDTDQRRFRSVHDVDAATRVFQVAGEGQYIVLSNPSTGQAVHPPKGNSTEAVDLEVGRKVNVPGPATFPLWPGQTAETIDGHHLRHNQYLVVRVYDPEEARANWLSAVVAPQVPAASSPSTETPGSAQGTGESQSPGAEGQANQAPGHTEHSEPPRYAMGQLIIVQGTDVSFYIPPTGIEVVPEEGTRRFVREAVTLERLEYCILLDENGEKRYVQGPDVVFPRPTEKFVQDGTNRVFRAIELNEHSGLYIKVIAEYSDADVTHAVGEELFITGKEQAIYFPRPEHSIIQYGDKQVHYAIAIPAGEGRYVLDRDKGTVDLVQGPKMFLPDPRRQVVVVRILDPHTVQLFYPGNAEALRVNEQYHEMSGRLTPGQHLTSSSATRVASFAGNDEQEAFMGDAFRRGTTYTPPRSIVLDTKYDGAVAINIWPGYAVLVTNRTGERRVEVGPKMVLLQYDETIMPLELSTGRPKDDANLLRTAYLRIINNQVSDRVTVETRDLVSVTVEISYRVNFEGETQTAQQKWFAIENYVKVLTDNCRSRLRNMAKRHGIEGFYTKAIDLIRDTLLGETPESGGRSGLQFPENGMKLYDVEVLNVTIRDSNVADLLVRAQGEALAGAIQLSKAEEAALRTERLEALKRKDIDERETTLARQSEADLASLERTLQQQLADLASRLQQAKEQQRVTDERLKSTRKEAEQDIALVRARDEATAARLIAETAEYVKRMEAADTLIAALQQFGDQSFVEKLVSAMGPAAMAAGVTTADLFAKLFTGTPFESMLDTLADRPLARAQGGNNSPSYR